MAYTNPSVIDFKAQFVRDFPYGTDINTSVLDADISSAFNWTNLVINQSMWTTQASYNLGYLLLSAHYLVMNMRASSQGLNGKFDWLEQSKGAGSVSASYGIPPRILENPNFAQYFETNYGAQYMQLLWPQLSGQIYTVAGRTKP